MARAMESTPRSCLEAVLHPVVAELTADGIAGATHAVAVGAAALDHETRDHPVEDQAVIKSRTAPG